MAKKLLEKQQKKLDKNISGKKSASSSSSDEEDENEEEEASSSATEDITKAGAGEEKAKGQKAGSSEEEPSAGQVRLLFPTEVEKHMQFLWEAEPDLVACLWGSFAPITRYQLGQTDYRIFFMRTILVPPPCFRPPAQVTADMKADHPQNVYFKKILQADISIRSCQQRRDEREQKEKEKQKEATHASGDVSSVEESSLDKLALKTKTPEGTMNILKMESEVVLAWLAMQVLVYASEMFLQLFVCRRRSIASWIQRKPALRRVRTYTRSQSHSTTRTAISQNKFM
jgi:hypothetical protein